MSRHPLMKSVRGLVATSASVALTSAALLAVGTVSTGADAAELRTWNRLAECESGGNWHINTGNGYYGGLQFSDPTWDSFKGPRMRERADNARKRAQIRTAEKLLDVQGWGAWPSCSQQLGLTSKHAKGNPFR